MNGEEKAWLALVAWSCLIFIIGVFIGSKSIYSGIDKELHQLQVERTQLEIKILKKECAND